MLSVNCLARAISMKPLTVHLYFRKINENGDQSGMEHAIVGALYIKF